jgi:uncharacterized protein YdaU (DUF1376 family)
MSLAYFPMFPTDFDADTGHLTFAEDGAYNRLLRLSWRCPEAKMPDDLDWICRKARAVTEADRGLIEAVLSEFFTRKGGKVFSARLHREWIEANAAHAKRVLAGKNGGKAKAAKAKENTPSNATEMPEQCPSNQNQNQNHIYSEANASDGDAVEDVGKQLFDKAVLYLGKHGTPATKARSLVGLWRKANSDGELLEALRDCQRAGVIDPIPWITARLKKTEPYRVQFDLSKFEGIQ